MGQLFRSNLFHCHEFVRAFQFLSNLEKPNSGADLLSEAERLIRISRHMPKDVFRETLDKMFASDIERVIQRQPSPFGYLWGFFQNLRDYPARVRKELIASRKNQLILSSTYVSEEVEHYYFAKAHELRRGRDFRCVAWIEK